MEHEGDGYTNCGWFTWDNLKKRMVNRLEDWEMRGQIETI